MPWPSTTEYNDAIQNLRTSVSDAELRAGELARTSRGLPMLWSGNFADVYRVHCPETGNTWAVKCFTRESPGLRERYRQISDHLQRARLPFMVDFEFVEPGILAGRQRHPFLKMRWVEGLALNQFVSEYVENRPTLRLLLPMWKRLSQMLREAEIAHCDLQHGNVLLVPAGDRGQLSLKLIDYDGMYVPSLGGRRSAELGHPAYQHPQRLRDGLYNAEVDRFSHLAVYCAVHCLSVAKREVWQRFDNGDNLLFRESDFRSPGKSELFRQLWALGDPDAHALVGHLALATQTPLHRVPLLAEVVPNGSVRRLNRREQRQVKALLGRAVSDAAPSGVSQDVPPAESAGRAAPQGAWWVSGQPREATARPSRRASAAPGPKTTEPARQPSSAARAGTEGTEAAGGVRQALAAALERGRELLDAATERPGLILGVSGGVAAAVVLLLAFILVAHFDTYSGPKETPPTASSRSGSGMDPADEDIGGPRSGAIRPETEETRVVGLEPLRITRLSPQSVEAGRPATVDVSVENAEHWEGQVRYSLGADAPTEATIDAATGMFAWTPAQEHAWWKYEFTVLAAGPDGQSDEQTVVLTVTPAKEVTATPLEEITVDLGAEVTLEMVLIPAGEFLMGYPDSDTGVSFPGYLGFPGASVVDADEQPQHRVRITQPFYLGKYEVTQGEWDAVMGGRPSRFRRYPITDVSWDDFQGFLATLNEKCGGPGATFSLPTEAQWEYACRAGSSTTWCFGDDEASLGDYAWYNVHPGESAHPVGQKRPNAWGLYDMHGNAWEWCADWYASDYYSTFPSSDPKGPDSGSHHVLRGGAYHLDATYARSADRHRSPPSHSHQVIGFRVARTYGDGPDTAAVPKASEALRITAVPPQTVEAGNPLSLVLSVENAEHWEGKVRFSLGPDAPSEATIDAETGMFTWTPTQGQGAGRHEVTVLAAGPDGQTDDHTFVVTVTAPKEIAIDLGDGVTLEMVLIRAGEFQMGSHDSDKNAPSDEKPQHQLWITQPFYLGKYEVTQEQWEAVMETNPSRFKGPKNPVEQVSWGDCKAFLNKLQRKHGSREPRFSLPTEAQWEYACRAGSSTRWCFGDDEASLGEYAWYGKNSTGSAHPVGRKRPNAWGLYDMHGNVHEWCADWYDDEYYGNSPPEGPTGPDSGSSRVIRGGSWSGDLKDCRSANRLRYVRTSRYSTLGIRVAWAVPPGTMDEQRAASLQPYQAYVIPRSVNGIVSTHPEVVISQHAVPATSAERASLRAKDQVCLTPGQYHLFKIANRGRLRIEWTGYADGHGSVAINRWSGNNLVSVGGFVASSYQSFDFNLEYPESEPYIYLLINNVYGGERIFTDALQYSIQKRGGVGSAP